MRHGECRFDHVASLADGVDAALAALVQADSIAPSFGGGDATIESQGEGVELVFLTTCSLPGSIASARGEQEVHGALLEQCGQSCLPSQRYEKLKRRTSRITSQSAAVLPLT